MKKIFLSILKGVTFWFWRRYMKRLPVPHPHGIPYERDPEAKCEFYEPFKPRKWYFTDCETDGHYLCIKCVHNVHNHVKESRPPVVDEREDPCPECKEGNMLHVSTNPGGGSMVYECDWCGKTMSFP